MMRYRMKRRYVNRMRIVLVCVLACLALLVTGLVLRHRLRREDAFPIGAAAAVEVMERRVIALQDGTLCGFNFRGKPRFETEVRGADALCVGRGVAAAYGDRDVYLFERAGKIRAHIRTDLPIRHVLCGASLVSVITQDTQGKIFVCTYDRYANLIDEVDSSLLYAGDQLLDAGIRGNLLWLLTVDNDGAQTLCHTYVFNVQNNTFLCRMDVYDQLIYDIFADEKNVFLIGTDSILCYNYNGMRQWQMPSADMTYVYGCEYKQNAALIFGYDNTEGGRLLYRTQGFAMTDVPKACAVHRNRLYLLLDDAFAQIDLSDDAHVLQTLSQDSYEDLRLLSGRRMLVFSGGQWTARMIP